MGAAAPGGGMVRPGMQQFPGMPPGIMAGHPNQPQPNRSSKCFTFFSNQLLLGSIFASISFSIKIVLKCFSIYLQHLLQQYAILFLCIHF
jgi:hypothetical protein